MLLSIALILLVGMSMGWICKKIKLPSLLGMMITGMILGPYVLNLLDDSILGISAELRKIALIIILTRAGLGLDLSGLKKIGRPAVMMCFVPATFEIVGIVLLAPKLMGLSILEAAIMGTVLAAVSPAVVVPRMVKLMEEGYGVKQGIPQLILAGASVDDVYVIVLFSTFTGMMQGQSTSILSFINIPVSIFLGIGIGLLIGTCLAYYFKKVHIRDTSKVLIILSISLLLVVMEDSLNTAITFSALIAIMFIGIGLQKKREVVAKRISVKYGKLWVAAEVFLFVLVGATVNVGYRCESDSCYRRCTGVPYAWCIRLPSWNKSQEDRTVICHDSLYTESNSSGRNRWNPSCDGICMRRYCSYRGRFSDCADSSAGRICDRFLV